MAGYEAGHVPFIRILAKGEVGGEDVVAAQADDEASGIGNVGVLVQQNQQGIDAIVNAGGDDAYEPEPKKAVSDGALFGVIVPICLNLLEHD